MNWRIPKASTLSLNCVSAIYLLIKLNLFVKRRTINFKIKTMLIAENESNLLIVWARRLLAGDRFRREERCTKYCSSFAFVLNVREFIMMLWKLFSNLFPDYYYYHVDKSFHLSELVLQISLTFGNAISRVRKFISELLDSLSTFACLQ